MADAQNLPANLRFFMSRLQGVSTSHYKIFPTAGDTGTVLVSIRVRFLCRPKKASKNDERGVD